MTKTISAYHDALPKQDKEICEKLKSIIDKNLTNAESKIWHAHPVWFIDGNPIVGYSKLKGGIKLMFWSGAGFEEPLLKEGSGKFKTPQLCIKMKTKLIIQISRDGLQKLKKSSGIIKI